MEWKSIQINKQNIKADIGSAILIAMPHNSAYNGFEFWHSTKLVRDGKNSNAVSISYNKEFIFNLKKYGKGKYNRKQIIDEIQIDYEEFEEAFNIMNENITAPKDKNPFETYKPMELKAEKTETLEELKDDDNKYNEFCAYLESEERNKDE